MTPRPDELDGPVAEFVAELATWRTAPAPPPSPALRALFAQHAVVTLPAAVTTRRTPMSESKRLLSAVPAKVAAGVLGALLAGSLGAGAMTGTIALTSQETDVPDTTEVLAEEEADVEDEVAEDEQVVEEDEAVEESGEAEEEEAQEEEAQEDAAEEPKTKDAGDPTTAPIPTSVSEAAKNRQFDEACGNHGFYVSYFARTGEEPECATAARGGAPAPAEDEAAAVADEESEVEKSNASAKGTEKPAAGKAKAAAGKAKAPGKAKAGR